MLSFIASSVNAKVLVLVTLVCAVFLGTLLLVSIKIQRDGQMEEIRLAQTRMERMARLVVWDSMTEGKGDKTKLKLEEINHEFNRIKMYVCDFAGNISYGAGDKDGHITTVGYFANPVIPDAVRQAMSSGNSYADIVDEAGVPTFIEARAVPNAPECHHCHGASHKILGATIMVSNVASSVSFIDTFQTTASLISLGVLCGLLTILIIFMKKSVLGKVLAIARNTERVAAGDFQVQFQIPGRDEISRLADNLGVMMAKISDQIEYQRGILSGIAAPLFVTDQDCRITFVNERMVELLQGQAGDFMGADVSAILNDTPADARIPAKVAASGQTSHGQLNLRRDQELIPVSCSVAPLSDAAGRVVGTIGLVIDISRDQEIRERISAQQEKLLAIAQHVTILAVAVSDETQIILDGVTGVNTNMSDVAMRTDQVSTAMDEMTATVLEVSKSSNKTATCAEEARKVAQAGGEVINRTIDDIVCISDRSRLLATSLDELSAKAQDIGQVMEVIGDIADQTNLLALNAAIEAARAGEAGRGFAVVADEVRKLAEKTMTATKKVEEAIKGIRASATASVREMGKTSEQVERTARLARQAGDNLMEIIRHSETMSDMIQGIATAAEQQSSASEQISGSTSAINSHSQETLKELEKATSELNRVANMSVQLRELVSEFDVDQPRPLTGDSILPERAQLCAA